MEKLFKTDNYCHLWGDATKKESYVQLLNGEKVVMLLADPPFCLLTRRNKKGHLRDPKRAKINHDAVTRYESVREYREFTEAWLTSASAVVKDDGILCIWTNFLGKEPIKQTAKELGFEYFYGEFKWAKLTKEGSGNEILARIYEVALIFSRVPAAKLSSDSPPACWSVVGNYDEDETAGQWGSHPNHKPFSLLEPLIRTYTKTGDIILDTFTGSGSTPEAACRLDRKLYGIEIKEEWAKITRERITKVLANK